MRREDETPGPPPPEIETLSQPLCRHLLERTAVGRIAFPSGGAPALRPVNFALQDGAIVIRTGDGTILAAGMRGEPASFEIDSFDPVEHTGASVVITGKLGTLEHKPAGFVPLRAWASGRKDRYVQLTIDTLSGIRIPAGRGNR